MRTWWSKDGKSYMLGIINFLSIVNKHEECAAREVWRAIRKKMSKAEKDCKSETINDRHRAKDIMHIADILELLHTEYIGYTKNFPKENADPFRDTIIATLTAFENGDTSMINAPDTVSATASSTLDKLKPPEQYQSGVMADRHMHGLQSMFWGDSFNKSSADANDSWNWFNFCQFVLRMEMSYIQKLWREAEKQHPDAIKHFKYVKVNANDGVLFETRKKKRAPVMTKAEMHFMLSQEGLWPSTPTNRQAAIILSQFIAEDASTIATVGATTVLNDTESDSD
jgi:hypothetical protein